MTVEAFNKAKELLTKISSYTAKLADIENMIIDCGKTAYSNDEINVQIYNGGGKSHSTYINRTIVRNMLNDAKYYYEAMITQYSKELEQL